MGKHSLPESPGFGRSVVIAVSKYLILAALLAGVGFGIYQLVSNNSQEQVPEEPVESLPPLPTDEPDLDFSPVPEETALTSPGATPTPTLTPSPTASPIPTGSPPAVGARRMQVLDGAGSGIRAARAVQQLEGAGYEVAATGATSRPYDKTTVFYQPGYEQQARDAAGVIGAADVLVAPANLDKSIPLAVVIGADYAG
jgi:hypothetical protein